MEFSITQFQEVVDEINGGLDDVAAKINDLPEVARNAVDHWYIPPQVVSIVTKMCNEVVELATDLYTQISSMMRGVTAPVYFWLYADHLNGVSADADMVAANLSAAQLAGSSDWEGAGAEAYRVVAPAQHDAAVHLGDMSRQLGESLRRCAYTGLLFYAALAVIVVKFINAMGTVIAAFGSEILSPVGAALVVEEFATNTVALNALYATFAAAIAAQVAEMDGLRAQATSAVFPDGRWPSAHAGRYDHPRRDWAPSHA